MSPAQSTARVTQAPAPRQRQRPTPLQVVGTRRRSLLSLSPAVVGIGCIFGALVVVVGGYGMLAQGQVRLQRVQGALAVAEAQHARDVLQASVLESPVRFEGVTGAAYHLVPATGVGELAAVNLQVPLPTPAVLPAPAGTSSAQPPRK